MASMRVLFLLATLTVAAANPSAGYDDKQEPNPAPKNEPKKPMPVEQPYSLRPTCGGCEAAMTAVREARSLCCKELSSHLECLCPTMNTLIRAGVPLNEVCYDDMACTTKGAPYAGKAEPLVVDRSKKCSVPEVCHTVGDDLLKLKECFSALPGGANSEGSCFAEVLVQLDFKHPKKVIEKLSSH